jgi:hypothetical protein
VSKTYRLLANTGSSMVKIDELTVSEATDKALDKLNQPLNIPTGQAAVFSIVRVAESLGALLHAGVSELGTDAALAAAKELSDLLTLLSTHHSVSVEVFGA